MSFMTSSGEVWDRARLRLHGGSPSRHATRYALSDGERIIFGQRIDGVVRVVDKPTESGGRSYLVEGGLTSYSELRAVVADYVSESHRRDEPAVLVRIGDDLEHRLSHSFERGRDHA